LTLTTWQAGSEVTPRPGKAVVRLPPLEELVERWYVVAPLLKRATDRTRCYEPIDLLRMAMAGQAAIWLCESEDGIDAALVTTLQVYPRRRVLEIMFAGGTNMKAWLKPMIATLDEHARQLGCQQIAGSGRAGWARAWGGKLTGDVIIARDLEG
jgi:hypothetical protein